MTTTHRFEPAQKCSDKHVLANRPTHPLNDANVNVRLDAPTPTPMYKNGATMAPKNLPIGIVWAVAGGSAVVDFGCTPSGFSIRLIVPEADLVPVTNAV